MSELALELAIGIALAAALVAGELISYATQIMLLAGVIAAWMTIWVWPAAQHDRLKIRLATPVATAILGFAAAMVIGIQIGPAILVLCVAAIAAAAAALDRRRLRADPLPPDGEVSGVVAFQGTAHATGAPATVPGTEIASVLWVARQGRRRWSSSQLVEIRSASRRVLVEPDQARMRGPAWEPSPRLVRAVASKLPEADAGEPLKLWLVSDGAPVYVMGTATWRDDAAAPTLRDPGRISVFTGAAVIGEGRWLEALRLAGARIVVSGALGACAAAVAIAHALRG